VIKAGKRISKQSGNAENHQPAKSLNDESSVNECRVITAPMLHDIHSYAQIREHIQAAKEDVRERDQTKSLRRK
jgi:pantothenate kinase